MRAKALVAMKQRPITIQPETWVQFKQWGTMAWKAFQQQQYWTYPIAIESVEQLNMLRTDAYEIIFSRPGVLQFASSAQYQKIKEHEQSLITGFLTSKDYEMAQLLTEQWVQLMPTDADWKYLLAHIFFMKDMQMKGEAMEYKALNQRFDASVYEQALMKAMSNGNRVKLLQLIQIDHPQSMISQLASSLLIKNEEGLKQLWINLEQHQQFELLLQVGHWAINFGMSKFVMPMIQNQLNKNRKDAALWMELKGIGLLKFKNSKKMAYQCLKLGQYLQKKHQPVLN